MELTDTSLLVVLGLVATAIFAILVVGWPHWRGQLARGASRAAQVVVLNLVVVALCGAALNDQYLFYSSWGDLLGSRSGSVQLHHGGSNHDVVAARVTGLGFTGIASPATLPPLPNPGVRLQSYTVDDRRIGVNGQVLVYLPAGYGPRSAKEYPVIIGLHGFPSSPKRFASLPFDPTIDTLTTKRTMAPTIVVIPRIDTPADLDTECVDGTQGQPQIDTWLSHDLPAWTAQHFHVQRKRTSWALVGYSYGAWCAASVGMRHSDVFAAIITMEGYFRPDFTLGYDPLTGRTLRGYDLVTIAGKHPPPIAMWVLTSREDGLSYPTTSKFLSVARRPLTVTAVVLKHGGHRDSVWEPYVPESLTWLTQTLPGFRG